MVLKKSMAFVEDRSLCKHGDGIVRRINRVNDTDEDVPKSDHLSDCRVRPVVNLGERTNQNMSVEQRKWKIKKG